MSEILTGQDLRFLIQRVFQPTASDHGLAILVDLPDDRLADNPVWSQRRAMAAQWYRDLIEERDHLGLDRISLVWFRNAGSNNADLPATCTYGDGTTVFATADDLEDAPTPFAEVFARHSLVLAPTELSATAPLKVAARGANFRAATMPGFTPAMIPALRLDYTEITRRVNVLKQWLDPATSAHFTFGVGPNLHELVLDLRHHTGHASGGLFPLNGVAGNLPSGEAYIVPYEGHIPGDASQSHGTLPVQIDDEVVLYTIVANKAVAIVSEGPVSSQEAKYIATEPAYANLAELGLGVLGDFGLQSTGSILLDEKLGLHIAFGRSDHFGGSVGPSDFSSPDAVIHLDRIYIPATQPLVTVHKVTLITPEHAERTIIADGVFVGLE